MDQPDRCEEGSLIGGQDLQEEELGTGVAEGTSESRRWWDRWAEY